MASRTVSTASLARLAVTRESIPRSCLYRSLASSKLPCEMWHVTMFLSDGKLNLTSSPMAASPSITAANLVMASATLPVLRSSAGTAMRSTGSSWHCAGSTALQAGPWPSTSAEGGDGGSWAAAGANFARLPYQPPPRTGSAAHAAGTTGIEAGLASAGHASAHRTLRLAARGISPVHEPPPRPWGRRRRARLPSRCRMHSPTRNRPHPSRTCRHHPSRTWLHAGVRAVLPSTANIWNQTIDHSLREPVTAPWPPALDASGLSARRPWQVAAHRTFRSL